MAVCDSLSDSDEVMSEPRTKLSLLCPTETLSLLAFEAINLFFSLSNPSFLHLNQPLHTAHALVGRLYNVVVRQEKKKNGKRKNPLHCCLDSWSLYSVIHPEACSTRNGPIYRVPLQQ